VLGAVLPASRPVRGGGRPGAERQSVCATNRAALAFFHRLVDSHNIMAAKIQGNYWMPEGGAQASRDAAVRPPLFSFCNSPRPSTRASSGNAVLGFIRDPVRGCYCGDCQKQEKGVAGLCAQESSSSSRPSAQCLPCQLPLWFYIYPEIRGRAGAQAASASYASCMATAALVLYTNSGSRQ
jgi:hypothetical protein